MTSPAHYAAARSTDTRAHVMLANFSSEILTFLKATFLGTEEEMSESVIDRKISRNGSESKRPTRPSRRKENEALYCKLLQGKLDHLTLKDRQQIGPVLLKYAHVFHD